MTLLLALPLACFDYDLNGKDTDPAAGDDTGATGPDTDTTDDGVCDLGDFPPEECGQSDECHYEVGGFTPIVEWDTPGENSLALPVIADIDGDGIPEVVANLGSVFTPGDLAVYHGDGSGLLWRDRHASLGMGNHPAVADIDGDGYPEIVAVRVYHDNIMSVGEFSVVAWDSEGNEIWESEHFTDGEMDHATGPIISDMDHDGTPEIVCGRVILRPDGTVRGVGDYGRGCPADGGIDIAREGTQPAVVDLDLDGQEEIIVGNAMYDADGNAIWAPHGADDGAVAVANLDDDPEGEFVVVRWNTIAAYDTDGSLMWGPLTNGSANIFPIPAIGDLDNDGYPEIVVAGGDKLWVLNNDGTPLWSADVHDESGATGASLFDFDGDGILEVVYIDETQMIAYNGLDGTVKFQTNEHASATMYDYPTIADVDADGHAEIVVAHDGFGVGFSVYGDATNSWAPARKVWNQHAYTITNINDDLSVPTTAVPNFTVYNSYHSGLALPPGEALGDELEAEILDVCEDDCNHGSVEVAARLLNRGNRDLDPGLWLSLYATTPDGDVYLGSQQTTHTTRMGMTSEALTFDVDASLLSDADGLKAVADDDGTGTGWVAECQEDNNLFQLDQTFCR